MEETVKSTLETSDDIQYELYIKGLSEDNVRAISADLQEPERMLQLRLESLQKRYDMPYPSRWPDLQGIREQIESDSLVFYARPKKWFQWYSRKREEVDPKIKAKFEKLGIPEAEKAYLAGAGWQYDSEVVYHNLRQELRDQWVIFEDMSRRPVATDKVAAVHAL